MAVIRMREHAAREEHSTIREDRFATGRNIGGQRSDSREGN